MIDFKKISKGYLINKTPVFDLSLNANINILGYNKNAFYYRGYIIEFKDNYTHFYDKKFLVGGLIYCDALSTETDKENALIKTIIELEKQIKKEKQRNEYIKIMDNIKKLKNQINMYNKKYETQIEIKIIK